MATYTGVQFFPGYGVVVVTTITRFVALGSTYKVSLFRSTAEALRCQIELTGWVDG